MAAAFDFAQTIAAQRPIATARLTLARPDGLSPATIVREIDDLEVARWVGRVPHPYTEADAVAFLRDIAPGHIVYAIRRGTDGAFVGLIGIAPTARPGEGQLGYWLGQRHWGQGYATEAGRAVVRAGFAAGLSAMISGYFLGNARSATVLEKTGFREVGRSRRPCLALGRELDHIDMRREREPLDWVDWPHHAS